MNTNRSSGEGFSPMNRRDFVKHVGKTALGGTLSMGMASQLLGQVASEAELQAPETRNEVEGMPYIILGQTNLKVSRICLGGIPWQPAVARRAIGMGVNLVHGANHYGTMEEQGRTLNGMWDKIWYVLKQNYPKEDSMSECLDTCLRTLKRDYVDIIVPTVSRVGKTNYEKRLNEFEKLQKAGKVRMLGVTVHSGDVPDVCREVIDAGIFKLILTMYQPERKPLIDKELVRAVQKNIGTMSMKTLQGADPKDQPRILEAALTDGTIHSVLKGIGNMSDLETYMEITKKSKMKTLTNAGKLTCDPNVCGACGACLACPQGVDIPEGMRCATYYPRQGGLDDYARQMYREIPSSNTIANCEDCGRCETICPRRLPIRQILREANRKWA